MKTISAGLSEHLAGEVTTLATCWKLTLTNETVKGFTDHDKNLVIDKIEYQAATGFLPTAIANTADLAVDNLDVEGMLDSASITEEDIMAGIYDFAEIEIFQVNYEDLSQGKLKLRKGWIGEVSIGKNRFVAEVRGLAQKLSKTIGELYSPSCRAILGDSRCKVNMAGFTVTGEITNVTSNRIIKDSARSEEPGYFTGGKITFTSGNNSGLAMEIKEFGAGGLIELALPMPYSIEVGDEYSMQAGCDKSFETCKAKFDNVINFRGEPHVPGLDRILQTSSTRSDF